MSNFLIEIKYDSLGGAYAAHYLDGQTIVLDATNYQDAVLEADMLEVGNYELGYN